METTLQSIGLRTAKSIALHLLLENAYQSKLVPDIANVDYFAGNLGRTNLQPLEGLPTFVDDLYVFWYLHHKECVYKKGKLLCTTGEDSSAQYIVSRISTAVRTSMGETPIGEEEDIYIQQFCILFLHIPKPKIVPYGVQLQE